jgi:hypothetical protein
VKTGKPGAQTDQTRTTVEITTAALEDVVGIQDVLYRTWLATYPSETFGINLDDIEEMYKDRNSEETLAKRREQVSRTSGNHFGGERKRQSCRSLSNNQARR